MRKLHVDIETYSSVDIKISGAYKYCESIDFEILLVAYAIDDEPVKIIDLANGEAFTHEFLHALKSENFTKYAHNAVFERQALKQIGFDVPTAQWSCSAIKSGYCGLPLSLDGVSKALKLGDKGKLSTGKDLIRFFCCPVKPTKANGMKTRNFAGDHIEKWEQFKNYCINDVVAEREIHAKLERYSIPDFDRINYEIDQKINDTGILIDEAMASNAVEIDERFSREIERKVIELTGVSNPNSAAQLKEWLGDATGKEVKSLAKASAAELLETSSGAVSEVLECRALLAKSSTKKYVAMLNCICYDGRAHGLFQFYGANRTGRWAGRLIQLQNLPQNHMSELEQAREVIRSGDYSVARKSFDNLPTVLSELIRTAFIAPDGYTLAVADFSAIEARVLSWVAGEDWRLDVFKTHGKIYEASASMMFGVPIESVTKGSDLRQKGKVAELALGYQGSVGALKTMGGEKMGLSEDEMQTIVRKWRAANPKIVQLWKEVETCAVRAIKSKKPIKRGGLVFDCDDYAFTIELPSGRKLFYVSPSFRPNKFDNVALNYMGMNQETKVWGYVETYGGKLVENIVQAISRDLLAVTMQRLDWEGFKIIMHVHDEVVCEVLEGRAEIDLKTMTDIMSEPIEWAKGLPLTADGYTTKFYKKD